MTTDRSHGLTPERAVEWKVLSDPHLSPDGCRVAFVAADVARPDEHAVSAVWQTELDTGETRRLTWGRWADSCPRWSPDGTRLAFLSDRETAGKCQLYVMRIEGGEATQITSCSEEVRDPAWSPDGLRLSYVTRDPETEEQRRRREERCDEAVADAELRFDRLYVVPAEGGQPVLVSGTEDAHVCGYCWYPDGQSLTAVTTRTPDTDATMYGPAAIVTFAADGGVGDTLLSDFPGMDNLRWSPDGACIAFLSKCGRVQATDVIWLLDAHGGAPKPVTRDYEGAVTSLVWAPDGREILFLGYENLKGVLRSVDVHTGEIRDLVDDEDGLAGSYASTLTVSDGGSRVAAVASGAQRPSEVWYADVHGPFRPATSLNSKPPVPLLAPSESVVWPSSDGRQIWGLLYRPLGTESPGPHPLVVQLHGGPAWLWTDRFCGNWHDWAQMLAAAGYAVFLPNPRGSVGRGAEFTNAEVDDMGGMELLDVLTGVDYLVAQGVADPDALGVGGWSHGGYLTAWTVTQTDRFKAAVVGAGPVNLISDHGQNDIPTFNVNYFSRSVYDPQGILWERSPLAHADSIRTPTLILHGELDDRVSAAQARELYRALRTIGTETQLVTYPREKHSIAERQHQLDLMTRVLGWYDRHLRDSEA